MQPIAAGAVLASDNERTAQLPLGPVIAGMGDAAPNGGMKRFPTH
jgi:hypothetical protein